MRKILRSYQWRIQAFRLGGVGGGGRSSRLWDKKWGRPQKKNFLRPFGPHFGLNISGGWGGSGPPGPCPGSATGYVSCITWSSFKEQLKWLSFSWGYLEESTFSSLLLFIRNEITWDCIIKQWRNSFFHGTCNGFQVNLKTTCMSVSSAHS